MSEVRAGDVIAGKFHVERILGEGGMGYVVAARHLQLGQMVALKFMREEVCNEEYKSRFLREARNTVRLKSKHVSRVLDVGSLDGGTPYMVMEYLEGTDLSDLLQQRGPFAIPDACDYIIQACEAIAEAHGHGIIHRDLKPANLFLTHGSGGEPVVKVLDFGVSKVTELHMDDDTSPGGRRHHDSVVTKATDLLGSPSYMAPEQVVSARDADSRSDVWSLGIILFRIISGKAPFTGNSLGELIQNIMHGPMPNLRDFRPDLPQGLEYVLWRALERERTRRPDVIELARLLSPYAGPNATPSLERIAILGPALITAVPAPMPVPVPVQLTPSAQAITGPSYTGQQGNWSAPPPPVFGPTSPKRDMSQTSFLVWSVLFAIVIASIAVIGAKVFKNSETTAGEATGAPAPTQTAPAPFATTPPPTAATAAADPPPTGPGEENPSPATPLSAHGGSARLPAGHPTLLPPPHVRPRPPAPSPAPKQGSNSGPAPAPPPPSPPSDIPPTRD